MRSMAILGASLAFGCAGWNGIVPVTVDVPAGDPTSRRGVAVRIADTDDQRHFDFLARRSRIPSIQYQELIGRKGAKRVIGRSRSSGGGNLRLPGERTVEDFVTDILTRSFREAGYAVTDDEGATAVEARVLEFWTWMTDRPFGLPSFQFRVRVAIRSDVEPFVGAGEAVCGEFFTVGTRSAETWAKTVRAGLAELGDHVTRRLESPSSPVPAWYCTPLIREDESVQDDTSAF